MTAATGSGTGLERQLDDERRALPGQRLGPHPAAVDLEEAARDREPEARAAMPGALVARAVERLEDALELRRRDARARGRRPGPGRARRCRGRAPTPDGRRRAARCSRAGSRTRARAARRPRARAAGRRSIDELELRRRRDVRRPPTRRTSSIDAPLGPRLGRVRLQPREVEQVVDQPRQPARPPRSMPARELAPLVVVDARLAASGSAAARIAVSGVRRSWLTARSSAVFSTSLRRSARVSTTSESSSSRSSAAASSASSAGTMRSCTRRSVASGAPLRQQERADLARALAEREREPPLVALDRLQLDRRRRRAPASGASRCAATGSAVAQVLAAQQRPRHLGGQVRLAPALVGLERAAPRGVGERARDDRGDEEDGERDPVLAVGDREPARRRDVEEVERERARHRRRDAQPHAPERRDEQHREQVDDAQRDVRRDVLERVDERASSARPPRSGEEAEPHGRTRDRHLDEPSPALPRAPAFAGALTKS